MKLQKLPEESTCDILQEVRKQIAVEKETQQVMKNSINPENYSFKASRYVKKSLYNVIKPFVTNAYIYKRNVQDMKIV